jgi:glycosyltransferase involved in cell wall biosynthesis
MSSAELAAQVEELRALGVRRVHSYAWRDLDDPEAGGSEVHADEILRRWAAAGLDIVHRTSTFDTPRTLQRHGYRVVQHGGRSGVLLRTPFEGAWRDRHTADAVIDIWNGLPWFSPLWFRGPRVTWLHHVHGKMWHEYFPRPIAFAGHFTESRIAPRIYRHHPVVTLAESGREELVDLGFRREGIEVIEPGLARQFVPDVARRSPTPLVVAVGRLALMKRHLTIVEAVATARREIPDLRLEIVGEGPDRSQLEQGIAALGAGEWCTLRGRVDGAALVDAYQRAWLFATASQSEGWGMVITEAAACGTPAVATRIVGHTDAVREGRSGVLVDTADEFASAFTTLLRDPDQLEQLREGALEYAASLSWDRAAERHLEVVLRQARAKRSQR